VEELLKWISELGRLFNDLSIVASITPMWCCPINRVCQVFLYSVCKDVSAFNVHEILWWSIKCVFLI